MKLQSDPDLGTPSGERLLSTILGSNKINFLYRGKEILPLNRGVPKSGALNRGPTSSEISVRIKIDIVEQPCKVTALHHIGNYGGLGGSFFLPQTVYNSQFHMLPVLDI
eukprot:sb/3477387/